MRTCLERKCSSCGTSSLEEHLRPLLETQTDADLKFDKWENITYPIGGVPKKRMTRSNKSVSVSDFITELVAEVEPYAKHLFNASWQGRQYDRISKDVPDG